MALESVTLRDPNSAAIAEIAPGFGFNCFRFTVEHSNQPVEILWSTPDFRDGTARPSSSGIPILFPFPGRIRRGLFQWQGREFQLPHGDGRGNAIHGFVLDRPWRVVEQRDNEIVGEFHASRDDEKILDLWPADFRIRVRYVLQSMQLACTIEIDNPDKVPLPFGLGTHPYFSLPLGGASREACLVRLPVSKQWELVDLLPTGKLTTIEKQAEMQSGMRFGDMQFDNVFAGLGLSQGRCLTSINDPDSGLTVEQIFDDSFRECVVYTPGHREAICIEPYTCVPDPFELSGQGLDTGLRVLQPGEKFTAKIEIAVK